MINEYRNTGTEVSYWLHNIFGLSLLEPDDAKDNFVEDFMPDMPAELVDFADYLVDNYIDDTIYKGG